MAKCYSDDKLHQEKEDNSIQVTSAGPKCLNFHPHIDTTQQELLFSPRASAIKFTHPKMTPKRKEVTFDPSTF